MLKAGVPCVPGSPGLLKDLKHAKETAKKVVYPVMIKATAGGGGKGMRIVWSEDEMEEHWTSARQESKAAFGNDGMYMEKFIEEPRHIEIQIAGDRFGNACHMSERDCSIQRRHQKLVEETPSPFMTDKLRSKMGEAGKKAAKAVKYEGVGTVEFLVDKNRDFYFMEMNTRIQVEHTITEEVINFDLIKEQIKIAAGQKISGEDYYPVLHSIQCRINAENPYKGFMPSPGKIINYHAPGGHGIRIDTHVYANYIIPPHYDSMISKLITVAQTREEAMTKMKRALEEYIIEGIHTTIPFHIQLMENKKFKEGDFTTKFMDDFVLKDPS
jgi:acetyl-CoA carboxylase biotin carboxylase subunit